MILELCTFHELCVTKTYFSTKLNHRVSWRHPRSKHFHQLDHVLTRRRSLKHVLVTRTYHSADSDTDNSLVCRMTRLKLKTFHCIKREGKPRIYVSKTQWPQLSNDFISRFTVTFDGNYSLTVFYQWNNLKFTTHTIALVTFGKKKGTSQNDWFEANLELLLPLFEAKR
ncbi:uncharacterized protein LOC132562631 [Ylistrum balloti]|uniref:uncharacterized protein LOC132562631 n=1 Tax=Ylistrum balloti TaxID=509963 RepID=UPI002905AA20|nr:uncharacterized protein LOC132562631 [Ylistrum balloti]